MQPLHPSFPTPPPICPVSRDPLCPPREPKGLSRTSQRLVGGNGAEQHLLLCRHRFQAAGRSNTISFICADTGGPPSLLYIEARAQAQQEERRTVQDAKA